MNSRARLQTCVRFAARDMKRGPWELLLAFLIVVMGSAGVVAVDLFKSGAQAGLAAQERVLLGADLMVMSRTRPTPEIEAALGEVPGQRASVVTFMTMASFPAQNETRFVQVRAIEGEFPFYGELETDPPDASTKIHEGALVDESLAVGLGLRPGETIVVGDTSFQIVGSIRSIPGDYAGAALIAPRVIVPLNPMKSSALLGFGAVARWISFYKIPEGVSPESLTERSKLTWERLQLEHSTPKMRANSLGRGIERGSTFFSLGALVSLLMALTGVMIAAQLFVKRRMHTIGILSSVGFRKRDIVTIYGTEFLATSLLGAIFGTLLGAGATLLASSLLREVLPAGVTLKPSTHQVILISGVLSTLVALAFSQALLPIVRQLPSNILRGEEETGMSEQTIWHGRWARAIRHATLTLFGTLLIFGAAWFVTGRAPVSGWFVLAIGVSLVLISFALRFGTVVLLRVAPTFPFTVRYAIRNVTRGVGSLRAGLYSITLIVTAISLLMSLRTSLLSSLEFSAGDEPNAVLFDIQTAQKDELTELLRSNDALPIDAVPLVTMRLSALKGIPVRTLLNAPERDIPGWTLRREYRSTYRAELSPTEMLEKGSWWNPQEPSASQGVSIEAGIAKDLQLDVGDEISFDVQGRIIDTFVQSIRAVDWKHMRPNFFIVFPPSVLEGAPQSWAFAIRTASPQHLAQLQDRIRETFPNVSCVDLQSIVRSVEAILSKISRAVQILVAGALMSAVLVLALTLFGAAAERRGETQLLRTLGAPSAVRARIRLAEAILLGMFSLGSAFLLSTLLSVVTCRFVLELPFRMPWTELLVLHGGTLLMILCVALYFARPMEARSEGSKPR